MPDPQPTPCSFPPCDGDTGEPCFNHEREQAHAEGDHDMCATECAAIMTAPEAWRD